MALKESEDAGRRLRITTHNPARVAVWALHLLLPLAGLWLLLARPHTDLMWQHSPSHFTLVALVAAVNVALGIAMSLAAAHRSDGRMFLVSLVFLSSAGFFLLHALATPGILIAHPNTGFDVAQPVGLALAGALALLASSAAAARVAARHTGLFRTALALVLVAWATVSLLDLPPLNRPPGAREMQGPFGIVAIVAVGLYLVAALRFYLMHRRRPAAVLVSIVTAYALLAEAMVAVALAQKWHLSWWTWHVLLTFAFGFVAYSAYVQYRREGSSAGLFDAIALTETTQRIRAAYEAALEELVAALHERERTGRSDGVPLAARMAARFGLTEGQAAVLDRAGSALARERDVSARLAALAAIGERAKVGLDDTQLIHEIQYLVRPAFGNVHIGLISAGALPAPRSGRGRVEYQLTVKGRVAGVLEAPAAADPAGAALLTMLADTVSISLENARLYRELGTLFRQYMSPDVAAALLADPDQAALGGSLVEVTALFADLRGFTTFSERVEPGEIVTMLNRYHGVAVPCILNNGGTIVQFVGDALLALFNAPARQPDHAARAVRAALAMQAAVDGIAAARPDWPRFRVGANTGPALVGNIGSETLRGFNAMGDAVNVAARLQSLAEPGQVVIGDATRAAIGDAVSVRPLGDLAVKGRHQTVRAFVVTGLRP